MNFVTMPNAADQSAAPKTTPPPRPPPPRCSSGRQASPSPSLNALSSRPSSASSRSSSRSQHRRHSSSPFEQRRSSVQNRGRPEITIVSAQPMANHPAFADGNKGGYIPPEAPPSYEQAMRSPAPRNPTFTDPTMPDHISEVRRVYPEVTLAISRDDRVSTHRNHSPLLRSQTIHHNTTVTSSNSTTSSRPRCNNSVTSSEVSVAARAHLRNLNHSNNQQIQRTTVQSGAATTPEQITPSTSEPPTTSSSSSSSLPATVLCNSTKPRRPVVPPKNPSLCKLSNSNNNSNTVKGTPPSSEQSSQQQAGTSSQDNSNNEQSTVNPHTPTEAMDSTSNIPADKQQNADILTLFDTNIPPPSGSIPLPTPLQPNSATPRGVNSSPGGAGNKRQNPHSSEMASPLVPSVPNPVPSKGSHPKKVPPPRPSCGPRKSSSGNTAPINTNPFVCENDFSESGYESIKYPDNKPLGGATIKTASPSLGGILTPKKVSSPSTVFDDVFMNTGYASISNPQVVHATNPTLGGMIPKNEETNPTQPSFLPEDPLDSGYASVMYPQSGAGDNSQPAGILTPTKATSAVIQPSVSLSDESDPGYASINYPLGGASVQKNISSPSAEATSGQIAPVGLLTPTKVTNMQSGNDVATLSSQPSPVNSPLAGVLAPTKANQQPEAVAKSPPGGQTLPDSAGLNSALLGDASKPVNSQKPLTPIPVPRRNKSVAGKGSTQAIAEPVYAAIAKKRASKADCNSDEGQPTLVHSTISNSSPPPPVPAIRPPLEDFEDLFSADEMNKALKEREKNQDRLADAKQTDNVGSSPGYASISTPGDGNLDDLLGFGPLAPSTDTSSKTSTTGSIGESTEEKIEPVYESRGVKNTQQDVAVGGEKLPHVVHSSRPPILPPPRSKKSVKDKTSDKKADKKVRPPLPKNRQTHTEELAGTSKSNQKALKSTEDNGESKVVTRKHSDGSKFAKNLKRRSMKLKNSMKIFKQKSLDDGKKTHEQVSNTETNTENKEEPPPKPGSKPPKPIVPPPPRPAALPTTKLHISPTSSTTPTLAKAKPAKPPPPKKGPTRQAPAPPKKESNPSNDLLTLDPIQVQSSAPVTVEEKTVEVTNTNNSNLNIFLLNAQILQPQPTPKPRSGSKNEGTTGPTQPVIATSKILAPHRPPPAKPNVKPSLKPKRPPPAVPPSKKVQSNYVETNQDDSNRKPQLGKEVSLGIHHGTSNEVSTPDGSRVLTRNGAAKPSHDLIGDTPDGKISTGKRQVGVALFDFTGSAGDELSFKAKEMITILAEENEDWFKGQIDDRQGIFPKNFVKIFENLSSPNASTERESVAAAVEISWDSEPHILPVGPEDANKNQDAIKDDFSTEPPMSSGIINEPRAIQHPEDAAKKMDAEKKLDNQQPPMSPDIGSEPKTLQLPENAVQEMDAEKKQDASKDVQDEFFTQPAMSSSIINEPRTPELLADAAKKIEETDAIEDGFSTQIAMSSGNSSEPTTLHLVTKHDQDVTVSSLDPVDSNMDFCNATSLSESSHDDIVAAEKTDDKTVMLSRSSMALFSFEGQDETELTFSAGDIITVTGKVNDEWLTGEINGKSGIFPSNYIKEITESTGESMTSATSVTNNLSHGANDDTVAPSSGGFVEPMATAIKDYTAPSSDEISFKMNDTLYLLEKFDSNWFMVQNDRSGSVGKVPASHVTVIHPLPEGGSSMSWIM